MRAFALFLLLLGAVAFAAVLLRHSLPHIPIQDGDLKIVGGTLLFAGVVLVWFSRPR
jgi:hypothetical protein